MVEVPQKILSYLVLFNSTPLQILYPWVLLLPRQGEVGLSWGYFLWLEKPYLLVFFAQKKRWPVLSNGTWKSFLVCKREAVWLFVTSSYTKVKKKLFCIPLSIFGYRMQFLLALFSVNRCLFELACASSNGQIKSRTFCGLCLVLVAFWKFLQDFLLLERFNPVMSNQTRRDLDKLILNPCFEIW